MNKTKVFTWIAVLMLLLSSWATAAAQTTSVPLTIINTLPKSTVVNLDGAKDYSFTVAAGQTMNKSIDKGNYKVKYEGCLGKPTKANLQLKTGKYELKIKPCRMTKWIITNPSSVTFTSELDGWMDYRFSVGPGQTKTVDLVAGPYSFKNSCGPSDTWTGKVKVGGNKKYRICG